MPADADPSKIEEMLKQFEPKGVARVCPSEVVTAEWVRIKCQYGCGGYGTCLTCPPHSPTPQQTRRLLDEYETAYLLWWGGTQPGKDKLAEVERQVFLAGFYKTWILADGPCGLCDPCPMDRPCRHPYKARPSMEACGIDVFGTARAANFGIEVVTTYEDTPNYFALLLVE